MLAKSGKYTIELFIDDNYSEDSNDNLISYDKVHLIKSELLFSTKIGLKIHENDKTISSAIIGSDGGGTGIDKNSHIIEDDRIAVCCSDSIFCLSIPELNLIWKTQADQSSCFEIFKFNESYIIHGEMEISRLDLSGEVMWKRSGADIFTTEKGTDDFEITESYIKATDWENRIYKFDFNGKLIE
ncbi:hypothetical protein [Marivirga arenosa]|uniref:Uncharacterized protein n=1 Tax=Marivirga arenosa TaxID=3059076 RepID=A0AA51ZW07_9BACT|nr:hypothetical protein [Marivirga sp. BKB1-2]WNB17761.1 hypothetical protein QYS47_34885 [Marivirga sp. BKB1-2]